MAAISKTPSGSYRGVFTSQPMDAVVDAVNNLQGNGTAGPLAGSNTVLSGTLKVTPTAIVSAGATQLGATLITTLKAVVTTATASSKGVRLPVWATGLEVKVINVGPTFGTKVYPSTGAKVGTAATNAADATVLAVNKTTIYQAVNTNLWAALRGA